MVAHYTCDHKGCKKKARFHCHHEDGSCGKHWTNHYCAAHDPEKRPLQDEAEAFGKNLINEIPKKFFGHHKWVQKKIEYRIERAVLRALEKRFEKARKA